MLFPAGVRNRPLGITVVPFLLIEVYKLPAGADSTMRSFFVDWQEDRVKKENATGIKNCWKFIF